MSKRSKIDVQGVSIGIEIHDGRDFINLTDMAKNFGGRQAVYRWMTNRNTIEFLGVWEQINNPDFNRLEFETFKTQVGLNSFQMTPRKWIEATGAIGIKSTAGRYGGGTLAHRDIAFEFGTWLSPEFKMLLIIEFQRLKDDESRRLSLDWNVNRTLAKLNYRIHTDAIKEHIVPQAVTRDQANFAYASEADLLNVAMFGQTAREWRDRNPGAVGNIRDMASIEQLLVLSNLENLNAFFIRSGLDRSERLEKLNEMAIDQMKVLAIDQRTKSIVGRSS